MEFFCSGKSCTSSRNYSPWNYLLHFVAIMTQIVPVIVPMIAPVIGQESIKKDRTSFSDIRSSKLKAAATYSPTWWGSTIGASELNFSVRYGKRWVLTAIATAVCFWKQIIRSDVSLFIAMHLLIVRYPPIYSSKNIGSTRSCRDISTGRLCHH